METKIRYNQSIDYESVNSNYTEKDDVSSEVDRFNSIDKSTVSRQEQSQSVLYRDSLIWQIILMRILFPTLSDGSPPRRGR